MILKDYLQKFWMFFARKRSWILIIACYMTLTCYEIRDPHFDMHTKPFFSLKFIFKRRNQLNSFFSLNSWLNSDKNQMGQCRP